MRLADGQSLLQKTLLRAIHLPGIAEILTVTNRDLFFQTEEEYRGVSGLSHHRPPFAYLLEPVGRNTAAAIAAAALHLAARHGEDALLLVLPADHLIHDEMAFQEAVARAASVAGAGYLVTFGIAPERPETGFGYIEADRAQPIAPAGTIGPVHPAGLAVPGAFAVRRFVEKPDLATAQGYLAAGGFYWNAGMFCFRAGTFLAECALHAPEVLAAVRRCLAEGVPPAALPGPASVGGPAPVEEGQPRVFRLDPDLFAAVPEISVDYAVMERSARVAVVTCHMGWNDIGSWEAASALVPPDADGNRVRGEAVTIDTRDCYIQSEERLVGTLGVRDLIIVDTPDALLVASRDRAQDVKRIVGEIKESGHESFRLHRTVQRPWGDYTVLEEGSRFKIKRIVVRPHAALSLQRHYHRSEHWVVVHGTARVISGEREFLLLSNESTFIPAGTRHRLENPGAVDLVIIEVQSGDYLGEDDIERFDDRYGRTD
jgi:mannose-1-phosphate guanylyltransferase